MLEMLESNSLLGNEAALRDRMAEKGYLLFRNMIPSDTLLKLRRDICSVLADAGWIESGQALLDALACRTPVREGEEHEGFFDAYDGIVKLESLYSLAHHPDLLAVMRQVLGPSAFPHPLGITRIIFPQNSETTTPPHQDYPNNQGTRNLTAAWIPLSNCEAALGGLAVLEGSNRFNEVLPLKFHLGAGARQADIPEHYHRLNWVSTVFKLGDILLFPALTIHKALDNHSSKSMRLSVDYRYQLEGEHLTETVLKPHFARYSWEEIYERWESKVYQYYWLNKNYVIDEWNTRYHQLPDNHLKSALKQEKHSLLSR